RRLRLHPGPVGRNPRRRAGLPAPIPCSPPTGSGGTPQRCQGNGRAGARDKLAEGLTQDFTARLKVKVDDVVNARVLASQARSQYNEYVYRAILALADLERITAGDFGAGLVLPHERQTHTAPDADGNSD